MQRAAESLESRELEIEITESCLGRGFHLATWWFPSRTIASKVRQLRKGEPERECILHPANLVDRLASILPKAPAASAARFDEAAPFVGSQRVRAERRQPRELADAHALCAMVPRQGKD